MLSAAYGKGSYFAVNASYSQGYAKPDTRQQKRMYLAKVLRHIRHDHPPPTKSSSNATDLYDSVADNSTNPTIFVVFNDIQATQNT
ncbi:hypothetical protein F7725_013328 [Dissostichus mawsoni]|uniref:PARP catalytic domain-containing protein n=1 Tax=Dissostichus mawsoni TaxID=36200 RepID=A0A7J5YPW5_DISMA|nr:hypothetical protein F7725_013328 [Dissostichus mawsoni]